MRRCSQCLNPFSETSVESQKVPLELCSAQTQTSTKTHPYQSLEEGFNVCTNKKKSVPHDSVKSTAICSSKKVSTCRQLLPLKKPHAIHLCTILRALHALTAYLFVLYDYPTFLRPARPEVDLSLPPHTSHEPAFEKMTNIVGLHADVISASRSTCVRDHSLCGP